MAKRKRTERRANDRAQAKLSRDLERLWSFEPGASAERPIVIASPSEVEVRARALPCPLCRGEMRVEEHTAETVGAGRLRIAKVVCALCRSRRAIYFQLAAAQLN